MASTSLERPHFFEGQYLGAEDLAALVDYVRAQLGRQNLTQHSWGIAIGLDLVTQRLDESTVEYYVQPGVAVDGYGRMIVVTEPARIEAGLFVGIASGEVPVWIRYEESERQGVRKGFEVCSSDDNYARAAESFAIEAGARPAVLDRQSGVEVNNTTVNDAREALNAVDPEAPLVCDGSIPQQVLPVDNESAYWLIPLGIVNWVSATTSFQALNDEQRVRSRTRRRYFGAVAEQLSAAGGVIRLRERFTEFDPVQPADALCAGFGLQSKDFFICEGDLKARELIWLEGHTRVKGDVRLFDGRLEFRDESGRDYLPRTVDAAVIAAIAPLLLQRQDNNERGGSDLQVVLGTSDQGINRFVIASGAVTGSTLCDIDIASTAKVLVQDNGRVGINTDSADALAASLTLRGVQENVVVDPNTGASADVYRVVDIEDNNGTRQWQLDLWSDQESLSFNKFGEENGRLYLQTDGNIGIGSTAPEAKLDIANVSTTANGSPLGDDLWFRIGDGGDDGRVWIEYGEQAAPLLVLSDRDDPPRIQFQQTDSEDPVADTAPVHSSWIGHAGRERPDLAIMGGQLGVNTTEPYTELSLSGTLGFKNGTAPLMYLFETGTSNTERMVLAHSPSFSDYGLMYRDSGDSFIFTNGGTVAGTMDLANGRVGVRTDDPSDTLDVRGNIVFGSTTTAGLLDAVGGLEPFRIIAGRVSATGNEEQGQGYTVTKGTEGFYTINFSPPFASAPIVVATLHGHSDNIVSVASIATDSCEVRCFDVHASEEGQHQNASFTFIALGTR